VSLAGFLLLRDAQFSFKKDVISFVDRIVEGDLYNKVRGKDMRGRDLNDLLQLVRASTMELVEWKKTLDADKIPTAFVMAGFDEIKGGASHYWNEKHQRNIVVELEGMGFDVVFVAPTISKGLNLAQSSWLKKYMDRCCDFKGCDTITFEAQKRDVQGREIEALSRQIADHLSEHLQSAGKVRKLFIAREAPSKKVLPQRNRIKVESITPEAISSEPKPAPPEKRKLKGTIFDKKKRLVRRPKKKVEVTAEKIEEPTPPIPEPPKIQPEEKKQEASGKPKAKRRRRGRKADLPKIDYNNSVIASY